MQYSEYSHRRIVTVHAVPILLCYILRQSKYFSWHSCPQDNAEKQDSDVHAMRTDNHEIAKFSFLFKVSWAGCYTAIFFNIP
jgi:hypothetical protein